MVKIRYKKVEVQMDVKFDEEGNGTVLFYNPGTYEWVETPRRIQSEWSYQTPEDNQAIEVIMEYLENVDWDLWLQDVEDDDIYQITLRQIPYSDVYGGKRPPEGVSSTIEMIEVERAD